MGNIIEREIFTAAIHPLEGVLHHQPHFPFLKIFFNVHTNPQVVKRQVVLQGLFARSPAYMEEATA